MGDKKKYGCADVGSGLLRKESGQSTREVDSALVYLELDCMNSCVLPLVRLVILSFIHSII